MKKIINSFLFKVIIILALLIVIIVIFESREGGVFSPVEQTSTETVSVEGTVLVEKLDFGEVVMGEASGKSEFIVLEQEVSVETKTSRSLGDIEILTKSQNMHSPGIGVYTVDLSQISESDIIADQQNETVLILIPHPTLYSVTPDYDNTTIDDIERGSFLAFGDIEMTQQEQLDAQKLIIEAMTVELETKTQLEKADRFAVAQVKELLQPIIKAVDSKYTVMVDFKD